VDPRGCGAAGRVVLRPARSFSLVEVDPHSLRLGRCHLQNGRKACQHEQQQQRKQQQRISSRSSRSSKISTISSTSSIIITSAFCSLPERMVKSSTTLWSSRGRVSTSVHMSNRTSTSGMSSSTSIIGLILK